MKVKGKELCSILNTAIREDDPTVIMHAVVLSIAINKRRVGDRGAKPGLFSGIRPKEYPQKIAKNHMGHGRTAAGSWWHGSWRGGGFRDEFQSFYKPGVKYRVPGVLATALSRDVALSFLAKASVKFPRILWCIQVIIIFKSDNNLIYKDNYARLNMIGRERANRALIGCDSQ